MKKPVALAIAGLFSLLPITASATTVTLTFNGLKDQEPIANYYNGGNGGFGTGPGPNYGITFGADSLAVVSQTVGGSGKFANAPGGNTVAYFVTGPGDVLNDAGGFTTGFSFFYSASFAGNVNVYSGLNGTGSLLATLSLPTTPSPYTVWQPTGVSFLGTAESAIFGGSANYIAFDNITLGSDIPGGAVPLPAALPLFASALAGLGGLAMKGKRQAKP